MDIVVIEKRVTTPIVGLPELVAEASEIGLKIGDWPTHLLVMERDGDVASGELFQFDCFERVGTEVMAAAYRTVRATDIGFACAARLVFDGRMKLTVVND